MKVMLLSKYSRLGPSSRLRTIQYVDFLRDNKVDVTLVPLFNDDYLKALYKGDKKSTLIIAMKSYIRRFFDLFKVFKYDVIWIEKEILPYTLPIFEFFLFLIKKPYIVDYDDAIFHNYDLSKNKIIRCILSNKIPVVMKYSTCVIAGNQYLARKSISSGAKNTIVLPTVVDLNRYTMVPVDNKVFRIGWIGSPSTQKYIIEISDVLNDICETYNCELYLIGATDEVKKYFPNINVQIEKWTEESESSLIEKMSVGIMPLHDGPWEKGKCGYKLVQYMAKGKPVVASDVGVNREIVENSGSGYLVNSPEGWFDAIEALVKDQVKYETCSFNGRNSVEKIYCTNVTKDKILKEIIKAGTL
ncbi:TPA: glycosyltransferase family 4 protein [Escherichia coli]